MENHFENQTFLQEFRTVVMGYRLHGQLHSTVNGQYVFFLEIGSSLNKQQKYQITFDQSIINSYKFVTQFSSPKLLYDHLSKMTKLKLKFNSEHKSMIIVYDKQKCAHEIQIGLQQIIQAQIELDKREIQTTFSDEKEQLFEEIPGMEKAEEKMQHSKDNSQEIIQVTESDKNQKQKQKLEKQSICKENQSIELSIEAQREESHVQQNIGAIENVEEKIEQLKSFLQMEKANESENLKDFEQKAISYTFKKLQSQLLTLYEFALAFKVNSLVEIIESSELQQTEQIVLKRTKLPEIPPFNQIILKNLQILNLQENKITKICCLQQMPYLQKLNLDGNKISLIDNLSSLTNLKLLKLGNNDIKKIQNLEALVNLETLWLDFNSISKIQGLKSLSKLKTLNLSFNMIKNIQNLQHSLSLEELLINENQICKIQNLDKLQKLKKLSLCMNSIQKVRGLRKLLLLQLVYLTQNQIQEFDKLTFQEFNWLKMLKQLKLNSNSIDWTEQAMSYVQRLKNYGVKVTI